MAKTCPEFDEQVGIPSNNHQGSEPGCFLIYLGRHTDTYIDLAIGTRCDVVDLVWCSAYTYTATALKGGERWMNNAGTRALLRP